MLDKLFCFRNQPACSDVSRSLSHVEFDVSGGGIDISRLIENELIEFSPSAEGETALKKLFSRIFIDNLSVIDEVNGEKLSN